MEEYLVCVHAFCEPSLESFRKTVDGNDLGTLLYAVKVGGATYAEMQKILTQNWIAANDGSSRKWPGFNMHPFVEKIEIDEGIVEFHASAVNFFSINAAHQLWSKVEIATAQAAFDRWLRFADQPNCRECEMLRHIMEEAKIIAEFTTEREEQHRELRTALETSSVCRFVFGT